MSIMGQALAEHLQRVQVLPGWCDPHILGEALARTVAEVDGPTVPQFTTNALKARTEERDRARRQVENVEQLVYDAQCNAMNHIAISSLIEALR